ncbi:hypothetical protein EV714DRAFT_286314 [Schizophyllum commune]
MTGKAGWLGDLAYALARLKCPDRVDFVRITTGSDVDDVIHQVEDSFRSHVRALLSQRGRLTLLRARDSMEGNGAEPRDPIQYRAYLDIAMPHHRKALTLILTGEHPPLDVRGGWSQRGEKVAREWRRCRFCEDGIEDNVADVDPSIRGCSEDPANWIHALCAHPTTCATLGKFAFDVLQLFGMHRAFSPPTCAWVAASDGKGNQDGGL